MDQRLLSGLLEAIMDPDGSFGLEHRLVCVSGFWFKTMSCMTHHLKKAL